jgi:hypothetical protein
VASSFIYIHGPRFFSGHGACIGFLSVSSVTLLSRNRWGILMCPSESLAAPSQCGTTTASTKSTSPFANVMGLTNLRTRSTLTRGIAAHCSGMHLPRIRVRCSALTCLPTFLDSRCDLALGMPCQAIVKVKTRRQFCIRILYIIITQKEPCGGKGLNEATREIAVHDRGWASWAPICN